MKIAVGTKSQLKIRAVQKALDLLKQNADLVFGETDSKISAQPFGLDEITTGATNRAMSALKENKADIGLGIENGIIKLETADRWVEIPVVVAIGSNNIRTITLGTAYSLPDWVIEKIKTEKTELGFVIQDLDPEAEKDPINYFSNGVVKREETLTQAIVCALTELIKPDKFKRPK